LKLFILYVLYILNKIIYKLEDWGSFRRLLSKCFDMPQSKSKIVVILFGNWLLILGTFENIAKSAF